MGAFRKVAEGEWQQPNPKAYKFACCDCGLVHTLQFRTYKGRIQMRAWRNERSTAQKRRYMNVELRPKG